MKRNYRDDQPAYNNNNNNNNNFNSSNRQHSLECLPSTSDQQFDSSNNNNLKRPKYNSNSFTNDLNNSTNKTFNNPNNNPNSNSNGSNDNIKSNFTFSHLSNSNFNNNNNNNNNNNSNHNLNTKNRDHYFRASKSIWDYYSKNVQSHDTFRKKVELKDALYQMFKDIFPYLGVYIVGSSANGFGTNLSDVDICLMISHEEVNQKTEAVFILKMIARALRKAAFIRKLNVIAAKVPIIKFHDCHNEIDCDININNQIGIRNTHLLKSYSDIDWRVKPLVLSIKRWAKFHDINDASRQTISSYSYALMAIYYMQAVCSPPVLPVLQMINLEKFSLNNDIRTLKLNEDPPLWTSKNTQSLGELLMGFLDFYSDFEFEQNIISIRTGNLISKRSLPRYMLEGQYSQWKYILIEEPFDLTNTARSVFDAVVFEQILNVFRKSAQKLKQTKNYESLFNEKFSTFEQFTNYDFYNESDR